MRARLANAWENVTSSLWFVPTLLVGAAMGLAALLLLLDELAPGVGGLRPWLFGGTADAARTLLSVIAGSLITVVALAFSITIVAVQQASTQFSPRVIRNFMRDRVNQLVFGVYIATFVYALLVLRQVREAGEDNIGAFVPALSITGALALALVCVGLLIFFIHHIATSLQVATITDAIRRELLEHIAHHFPDDIAPPPEGASLAPPLAPPTHIVRARGAGFLRAIEEEHLFDALGGAVAVARVRPGIGAYVLTQGALAELWATGPLDRGRVEEGVRTAFAFDRERTPRQDVLFGVRQLVDIALKALSPGINDPTTAEYCLSHLGDVVAHLADRPFPPAWRRESGRGTLLVLNRPSFADIVDAAFSQIRREADDDVHVTGYLLGVLAQIAPRVPPGDRAAAIRHQLDEALRAIEAQGFSPADAAALRSRAATVRDALAGWPPGTVVAGPGVM